MHVSRHIKKDMWRRMKPVNCACCAIGVLHTNCTKSFLCPKSAVAAAVFLKMHVGSGGSSLSAQLALAIDFALDEKCSAIRWMERTACRNNIELQQSRVEGTKYYPPHLLFTPHLLHK